MLGLRPPCCARSRQMIFTVPTPIQAAAIPPALTGKDILGTAQTGTGKTAAFGIPLVSRLLAEPQAMALVMTPTRELATQVMAMITQLLGEQSGIRTALLIGGDSMQKQIRQLKAQPAPDRRHPRPHQRPPGPPPAQAERGELPRARRDRPHARHGLRRADRQDPHPHAASAPDAALLGDAACQHPQALGQVPSPTRCASPVGSTTAPSIRIKQENIQLAEVDKYGQLLVQLQQRQGSIIVFVKTKWGAEKMAKKLRAINHSADAIHGDLRQHQRDRAIAAFRNRDCRIMVATDIAARGSTSAYRACHQLRPAAMPRGLHPPHRPHRARRGQRRGDQPHHAAGRQEVERHPPPAEPRREAAAHAAPAAGAEKQQPQAALSPQPPSRRRGRRHATPRKGNLVRC